MQAAFPPHGVRALRNLHSLRITHGEPSTVNTQGNLQEHAPR